MQERSADVNAAYWKAIPEAFEADGIEGVGLHPVRWTNDEIARSILGRMAQNAQPLPVKMETTSPSQSLCSRPTL